MKKISAENSLTFPSTLLLSEPVYGILVYGILVRNLNLHSCNCRFIIKYIVINFYHATVAAFGEIPSPHPTWMSEKGKILKSSSLIRVQLWDYLEKTATGFFNSQFWNSKHFKTKSSSSNYWGKKKTNNVGKTKKKLQTKNINLKLRL